MARTDLDRRDMWQLSKIVGFLALVCLGITPVIAGDRALVEIIGYSESGRYFAFEEFGVQDGSGFAYSNTYLVDLDHDRWVVGTPVRRQSEDEAIPLRDLRAEARAEILPHLVDLEITRPTQSVAVIGDGARGVVADKLEFGVPGFGEPGAVNGQYSAFLKQFEAEAGTPCLEIFDSTAIGFSLSIEDFGVTRQVHRDRTLPRSRGCPLAYRIYGIYLPFQATDISRAVALISVFSHGFEGADRRFLAVPLAFTF